MLVGGYFQSLTVSGITVTVSSLVRLNEDGTPDILFNANLGTGFNNGADDNNIGTVLAIEIQDDGKILVGGEFDGLNSISRAWLVRLHADGTVDTEFGTNIVANNDIKNIVRAIAIQPNGRILIGGAFTSSGSERLTRVYSNGLKDHAFYDNYASSGGISGAKADVYSIKVQYDGKILIGGVFDPIMVFLEIT